MTISFDLAALRVAAAKDVLTRLLPGDELQVTTRAYVDVRESDKKPCRACAVGFLLLAVVTPPVAGEVVLATGNTASAQYRSVRRGWFGLDQTDFAPILEQFFDPRQLALIETAFMQHPSGGWGDHRFFNADGSSYNAGEIALNHNAELVLDDEHLPFFRQLESAAKFGEAEDDDRERLVAIMKNIVKNGGTFVPGEPE